MREYQPKKFTEKTKHCKMTNKVSYKHESDAANRAKRLCEMGYVKTFPYLCVHCQKWHLTKQVMRYGTQAQSR